MKSAIAFLKLIGILLVLQWLCSCNSRSDAIKQIQAYRDSIGIAKISIVLLQQQVDSIRQSYYDNNQEMYFPNTADGQQSRQQFLSNKHDAYMKMIHKLIKQQSHCDSIKWILLENSGRYKHIIDSLKLIIK